MSRALVRLAAEIGAISRTQRMILMSFALACTTGACAYVARASIGENLHGDYISRSAPHGHVLLVPELQGGSAGWCVATAAENTSGCGGVQTSTGPVFAEAGCNSGEGKTDVYALTTSKVRAVSVDDGSSIPTSTNVTLPDGLRSVAVEIRGQKGQAPPDIRDGPCPRLTPLNANLRPIQQPSKRGTPLDIKLPGTLRWERPTPPPHGVCQLRATHLPPETSAHWGSVATAIRPSSGLIGRALLSCIDIDYFYLEEHSLDSAVLLDAEHPGATPPSIPGMKPLAGHPGIFLAPGAEGERVARRIPGAWLVVEENDEIGLRVPLALLGALRARVDL
jgi:hypothetical protein